MTDTKILDSHFDRVFLITLDAASEKSQRAISFISKYSDKLEICKAIRGSELYPAKWWRAGNGAWGCLQSHIRIAQDVWTGGGESYVVFEEDAIMCDDFDTLLQEFMGEIPENWDQIYLGGQHRATPRWVSPRVLQPRRVNRTHCFALKREIIPSFLNHITDFDDHVKASYPKHIDHRLEDAHRTNKWNVYSPSWWLVGQGENWSDINGRHHPNKWWDHDDKGYVNSLPFIHCDRAPTDEEKKYLHFGWAERKKGTLLDPYFLSSPDNPRSGMKTIANEAFSCRRLPAAAWFEVDDAFAATFKEAWPNQIKLSEADLPALTAYPNNGLFEHRWLNSPK